MRLIQTFVLGALLAGTALGQTTVYDFLHLDPSGRGGAMAGAFITMQDDPNLIFYNPAALATVSSRSVSFSYMKHVLDINAGFASYAQPLEAGGAFGVGVDYMNYGTFPRTDASANELGSFGASDVAVSAGYANTLDSNLYYGAAVKGIFSSIDSYHSQALAVDAGLLYVIPERKMAFGISIQNAGTQLSTYIGTKEPLPLDIRIGGSVQPKGLPLLLNLNFHKLSDQADNFVGHLRAFQVGGEFIAGKALRLRFGYDNEKHQDQVFNGSNGLGGMSAGIGILVKTWRIDYGISSWNDIGTLHRISVSAFFPEVRPSL